MRLTNSCKMEQIVLKLAEGDTNLIDSTLRAGMGDLKRTQSQPFPIKKIQTILNMKSESSRGAPKKCWKSKKSSVKLFSN